MSSTMSSNSEQLYFINKTTKNMKLIGIPGGGKTRTIIEKIIYMKKIGEIKTNHDFLILTFSRKSREDFLVKGQEKDKNGFSNDNVRTIHSLSAIVMKKVFNKTLKNINTLVAGLYHLLETNEINFNNIQCLKNCKYIFVDEAQDISEIQYLTIQKISSICNGSTIMIGDPDQNIYQFQGGSDTFLIEHDGERINLIKNYRSTESIVNFINEFRPWKDSTQPMIAMREVKGKLPKIYCDTIIKLKEYIINEIEETNIPFEDIAIIGPVKKGNFDNWGIHKNFGLQIIANLLEEYDYKYEPHYNFSDSDNISKRVSNIKEGHINLYTIHGSKGLEFKKVIILNFHLSTMGRIPTQKKYNEFKYLWYVGLSRASDELSIAIESNKNAWTELKNVNSKLYKIVGANPKYKEIFKEETKPDMYGVTKLLENELFNEQKQFYLENKLNCEITEIKLFDKENSEIYEHDKYSSLYGIFIEHIFRYNYEILRINDFSDAYNFKNYIESFIKRNNLYILIPEKYNEIYKNLKNNYSSLTLSKLKKIKNDLNIEEKKFYEYLLDKYAHEIPENQEINIIKNTGVSIYDEQYVIDRCKNLENRKEISKSLFELCVYFYQIENECGHILKDDFTQHINSLEPYIHKVKLLCKEKLKICKFQGRIEHPHLPISGVYDAITKDSIIDFKFTKSFNHLHVFQLLLYYNNLFPLWDKPMRLEVWNLYNGTKYIINIDKTFKHTMLNEFLCETFHMKMKHKVYIYDLETTGLFTDTCDIIERHFVDYFDNSVISSGLIKPKEPLTIEISNLTGIKDNDFINADKNITNFKSDIQKIFKLCENPIFIAHNGNIFDHKILKHKKILNEYNCILLDSREIINSCYNTSTYNKKLGDIYEMIIGHKKKNMHRADTDTDMIVEIFKKMDITNDKILSFVKTIK